MLWMTCAIVICVFITKYGENLMHMTLFGRPIFIGFVAGLLLGDMQTGILIGAQLELAFMGIVIIGATAAADPAIATIITVAVSINNNLPAEAVIPLGMTIGYAASVLGSIQLLIAEIFVPIADKYIAEDNQKKLNATLWLGTFCSAFIIPTAVCVAGVLLGGDLLDKFINSLPAFILNGIGAAGAMLPALGISMILSLLVNTRTAIYFMSGFVIYKYLGVDMIFMLVIGLLLAITDFTVSAAIQKNRGKAQQNAASEEEEFLS